MITAHLPAGYLFSRTLPASKILLAAALFGSVLPDFDLLWFYFQDGRSIHHHRYWVHIPGFWVFVAMVVLPLASVVYKAAVVPLVVFLTAILIHLVLDTIAGGILWLWPFDHSLFSLLTVEPAYSHWIISFVFHWSFVLEIAVWILAFYFWVMKPRSSANQ